MTGTKGTVVAGKRRRLDPGRMPDVAELSGADSGTSASPAKGPAAKRPKRNYLDGWDDEDDLLAYLDAAYEMEKNSIGRDGVEPCEWRIDVEPIDPGECVVRDGACEHGEPGGDGDDDMGGWSGRSEHGHGKCFRPKRHGCSDPGECAVRDDGVETTRRHGNGDHAEDGGGFNGGGGGDHDGGVEIARSSGNGEQAMLHCGLKDEGENDNGVNPEQDCSEAVHDDQTRVLCNNGDELKFRAIASFAMAVVKWNHISDSLAQTPRLLANTEDSKVVSDMSDVHVILHAPQPLTYRERNQLYHRKWRDRQATKRANIALKKNLTPLSDEGRAEVLRRLQRALGPEGLDECVCVSCDRLVRREEYIRKEASDWQYIAQMRQSFDEVDSRLPSKLREEYIAPVCVTYLSDVMVSPRSFRCYIDRGGHWTAWFSVCNTCNASIESGCLPKFSISNGFYIGSLPGEDLQDLTLPERFMTQLMSIAAMTRVMRGGRHRCIRSHCVVFDCTPAPPLALLPRSIAEVSAFRVAMVGHFTEAQTSKVKRMHEICGQRVRDVFNFYQLNNRLYSSITSNDDVLNNLVEAERVMQLAIDEIENNGGEVQNGIGEEQENIRGHTDEWRVTNDGDELNVVERRTGLSDASRVLLSQEHELFSQVDEGGGGRMKESF